MTFLVSSVTFASHVQCERPQATNENGVQHVAWPVSFPSHRRTMITWSDIVTIWRDILYCSLCRVVWPWSETRQTRQTWSETRQTSCYWAHHQLAIQNPLSKQEKPIPWYQTTSKVLTLSTVVCQYVNILLTLLVPVSWIRHILIGLCKQQNTSVPLKTTYMTVPELTQLSISLYTTHTNNEVNSSSRGIENTLPQCHDRLYM